MPRTRNWLLPALLVIAGLGVPLALLTQGPVGSAVDSACRSNPSSGVHDPGRLTIKSSCTVVEGTVVSRLSGPNGGDGDWTFNISVDSAYRSQFGSNLHCEIVPQDQKRGMKAPAVGTHVRLVGPFVVDTLSGNKREIHPVWSIGSAGGGGPVSGSSAALGSSPVSVGFADQLVGTAGPAKAVKVTNSSSGSVDPVVSLNGGDAGAFAVASDTCSRSSLGAGRTCTVEVTFSPATAGAKSGSLHIGNSGGSALDVPLKGTGIVPPLTFSPAAIDFGVQPAGSAGASQTVTVTNSSGSRITISSVAVAGSPADFTASADSCSKTTLGPGHTCTVTVTAKASAPGDHLASMTVKSSAAAGLAAVPLSVAGTAGSQPPAQSQSSMPSGVGPGYWLVAQDGGLFGFGGAGFKGSTGGNGLKAPVVGMAATPSRAGYWLAGEDGVVFPFGDAAPFHGLPTPTRPIQPIAGIAGTPTGRGFWLVARDGGIFSFGDAVFKGSTGAIHLNQPIVGMAATPSGHGYWLVARDGGIFSFGDAVFKGSTGAIHLNQPIVGMAATPAGHGYWLVARDGGIFSFGDAVFKGSTGAIHLNQPIVGMAPTASGLGYWLVARDGGIFSFGDAVFKGSTGAIHLNQPIVGMSG